jgi:hypothetical protein
MTSYFLIASLMGVLVGWFIEFVRPGGSQDLRDQLAKAFEYEDSLLEELHRRGDNPSVASKDEVSEQIRKSSRSLPDGDNE